MAPRASASSWPWLTWRPSFPRFSTRWRRHSSGWGRVLPRPSCLLSCWGACCLLTWDIVGSRGFVVPLRLVAALGRFRRVPCSEPHLCAVREARALRQSLPVVRGSASFLKSWIADGDECTYSTAG
ncbi:hypothetical protein HPB50_007473 [Hyalomma asiaticum]|uniref:Uncharacterized protein n=1 Tax=Hyalomma asiaticum TaxID=266040 RepID=A0ACB7TGC8_HYAAI|nr:hypothetical protein HPB50_007473 [Hyalomma asiaticum]